MSQLFLGYTMPYLQYYLRHVPSDHAKLNSKWENLHVGYDKVLHD